jgi:hypothetical protein
MRQECIRGIRLTFESPFLPHFTAHLGPVAPGHSKVVSFALKCSRHKLQPPGTFQIGFRFRAVDFVPLS